MVAIPPGKFILLFSSILSYSEASSRGPPLRRRCCALPVSFGLVLAAGFLNAALAVAATPSPTTTELTISPAGSVSLGDLVTLKATVSSAGAVVSPGLVLFCNAASAYCEDLNILGQAQLTASGTASLNVRLPIGTHRIRAQFQGTTANAPSSSPTESLTVGGKYPTGISFAVDQGANYLYLDASIIGYGKVAPTGTLAFDDIANHLLPIGTSIIGSSSLTVISLEEILSPLTTGAVADLNRDGKLDQLVYDSANNMVAVFLGNGDGRFTAGQTMPVGTNPDAIAVGDFNNDDKLDFAVANYGDGTVSIFLGNGDGTFSAPTTIAVGQSPNYISVGDFNNDGNADLIVSSALGSSVWLGDGKGGFATFSPQNLPRAISPIRVADINGDGIADLTYVDPDYLIFVYIGTGLGTFNQSATYPAPCGGACKDVIVADFNSDGKPDVAIAGNDSIQVVLGTGEGNFGGAIKIPDALQPLALFVGDFNGDGQLDIGEADANGNIGDPTTNLFLGNGEGEFSLYEWNYENVRAVGDFNGDGLTDLGFGSPADTSVMGWFAPVSLSGVTVTGAPGIHEIFANYEGDATHAASVSGTQGLQGPRAASTVTLEATPTPIAPGQAMLLTATISPALVDGAGPTGTVTFSNGPNPLGTVSVSQGKASFSTTTLPIGSNITLTAFYSGDSNFNFSVSPPVHIMARGTLRPISTIELSVSPAQPVTRGTVVTLTANVLDAGHPVPVGLVNFYSTTSAHPGKTIVGQAQLTANGVATMKFRPPLGSLQFQAVYQGTNTHGGCESAWHNLTVTGKLDTSTTISVDPPNYSATVTAYGPLAASGDVFFADATNSGIELASAPLGPSNAQYFVSRPTSIEVGGGQSSVKVADFNGDGILDAVVNAGGLTILLGNPDGTFTQKSTVSGIGGDFTIADFNGDGIPDIAGLAVGESTTVLVFLGRGDGTFIGQPPVPLPSYYGAASIVSGDFNGDGTPDLLLTSSNFNDNRTVVLLGNGEGGFRLIPPPTLFGMGDEAIVADFNGDGIPDVAVFTLIQEVGALQPSLTILLGNGDGTFVPSSLNLPCDEDSEFTVADFNGDGFPDIVVANCYYSQNLYMLLGTGNATFAPQLLPQAVGDQYDDPLQIATGDLNSDGIPDLVLSNGFDSEMGILLGKGDGTFFPGPVFSVPGGAQEGGAAIADFNGDGISDILSTASDSYYPGDENVTTMYEWHSSVAQTSQATATNVTLPGSGTQQVFALYPGDTNHIGSVSPTVSADGTQATTKEP